MVLTCGWFGVLCTLSWVSGSSRRGVCNPHSMFTFEQVPCCASFRCSVCASCCALSLRPFLELLLKYGTLSVGTQLCVLYSLL